MLAKIKNATSFFYLSLFLTMSSQAYGATVIDRIKGELEKGWLSALITAGIGAVAFKMVIEKWTPIFEGNDSWKHLLVIGAWCGLTIWWKEILTFCLNVA